MFQRFPALNHFRPVPIMITQKRGNDWIAFLAQFPLAWESGRTEAEAIGRLHVSHPHRLRVRLHREKCELMASSASSLVRCSHTLKVSIPMHLSQADPSFSDGNRSQAPGSGARALTFRYFHTGRYILDRERILSVVDASPEFVEIWLAASSEERLRLKSPSSQQTFLDWYTQSDPA
jgi:hypothetical protein